MARKARKKSESGMYHVVLKGNNKLLFAEDEDYVYFLKQLEKVAERDYMEVYAYCLFSETAHLVIKEGLKSAGESLKALISSYAVRCNAKYSREGKLFYDRYISEPIEGEDELVDAVRFVHRLGSEDYKYSSYLNYLGRKGLKSESLMLLFDDSTVRFREENSRPPERSFATGEKKKTLTDSELSMLIKRIAGSMTAREAEEITLPVLGELTHRLAAEGASIRQLSRVLKLSKGAVEKSLKIYRENEAEHVEGEDA